MAARWSKDIKLNSRRDRQTWMVAVVTLLTILSVCTSLAQDIRRPPSIITPPILQKIYRTDGGDALVLDCVADGVPTPEYSWKKNGQLLTGLGGRIVHLRDGTISIPQLGPLDEGYYQCFANNQHGTALSHMVVLQRAVLGGYTSKTIHETGPLKEGQSYTLNCMPTKWFPKPVFTWAIVNSVDDDTEKPVITDRRVQIDVDGNLHFSYLTPADAQDGKLYKCKLFNPVLDLTIGGSYTSMKVESVGGVAPFAPKNMFVTKSPVIGLEGKDLTLRCFFSGNPLPLTSWSKVDGSLPIGFYSLLQQNTEIHIKQLRQTDAGQYMCSGQNSMGTTEEYITIDVQAVPVFKKPEDGPKNLNVTEGDTVTVNCNAYAEPDAEITWLKNGVRLDPLYLPQRFRLAEAGRKLIIQDVCRDCKDGGTDLMVIQCNASNVHGYAFGDGYINILKKTIIDKPPVNRTLNVDEDTVIFEFDASSDDSTPITLQWYRVHEDDTESRVYTEPGRTYVKDGLLQFTLPNSTEREKYRGLYRARADNGYSQDVVAIILQVEDMSEIPAAPIRGVALADYWWLILLIALILLLLILLLCCCICIQRNKGDSYPVDEKERQNGNNPAKELADSGFQDYHRPDGEMTKGSRASLNSSIKMDSDEEASLNEYGDIDAGKFTEDGSFIGDYNTDRRNRSHRNGNSYA